MVELWSPKPSMGVRIPLPLPNVNNSNFLSGLFVGKNTYL